MKINRSLILKVWNAIIIVLFISSLFTLGYYAIFIKPINNTNKDYMKELELSYWHTKSELVDEVNKIIKTYAPTSNLSGIVVVNACQEFNIDVKFVLCQGLIESHFGTKGLASKTNSVWNVGAYDGLSEGKIHKTHKFNHPDKSVRPYLKILKDNYLGDIKTEYDLMENFIDLSGKRYATYVNYEREMKIHYEDSIFSRLDSLTEVLNSQRIRLNR